MNKDNHRFELVKYDELKERVNEFHEQLINLVSTTHHIFFILHDNIFVASQPIYSI